MKAKLYPVGFEVPGGHEARGPHVCVTSGLKDGSKRDREGQSTESPTSEQHIALRCRPGNHMFDT